MARNRSTVRLAMTLVALILLSGIPLVASRAAGGLPNAQARAALQHHCLPCHSGEGSPGGDFHILEVQTLTDYVEAGSPEDSYLLDRISRVMP